MKTNLKGALIVLIFSCGSAWGQDPGMMAAQQAMQASQQATQQALQDMQTAQQANQQAMQAAMQANDQFQGNYFPGRYPDVLGGAGVLSISVAPGNVKPGTKLRINLSSERNAKVYYTTDGWTPTTASTLYTGPIKIDTSMLLQAIAVGPGLPQAMLIRADYTVNGGAAPPIQEAAVNTSGALAVGTQIRLATGSEINSATARAGDKATILLDEDLKVGDTVVAAKGTPVDAVLTLAVPAKNGASGQLAFQVQSLTVQGRTVSLAGSETLQGGVAKDAVIKPGMGLTAKVSKEVELPR
jgi:Chitobiase/beta-hexosaminidase C-terminal domain